MTAARIALLVALAAAGCRSHPAPGAYLCNPSDNACPGGKHCTCGQCVDDDSQAACKFQVTAQGPVDDRGALQVVEYQRFKLDVAALAASGAPASNFAGTVALTFELPDGSRWSSVDPPSVTLQSGSGEATVRLNRETIPPRSPMVVATFGAATGQSQQVDVHAPTFVKDPAPLVPPAIQQKFGWVDYAILDPATVPNGSGPLLLFSGVGIAQQGIGAVPLSAGCAQRGAGCTLDPPTAVPVAPLLAPTAGTFFSKVVAEPAPIRGSGGITIAFAGGDGTIDSIGLATSPDGVAPFAVSNGGNPVLAPSACQSYCGVGELLYPSLLTDGAGGAQVYFSSAPGVGDGGVGLAVVVGRADSPDGLTFTPEPAPLLDGEVGGEAVLLAPRVLLDRGVYKMWYTYARALGTACNVTWEIGYATSSDGLFWVRSPSNPVVRARGTAWEATSPSMQAGAVVPLDGVDPANGLAMYYTGVFSLHPGAVCLGDGVGRAVTAEPPPL